MKILALFFTVFVTTMVFGQDLIVKRDGEVIEGKVIEITETTVKYKRADQQDGPIRNIAIKDVKQIEYADGTKEHFVLVENNEKPKVEDPNRPPKRRGPDRIREDKDRLLESGIFVDILPGYGYGERTWPGTDYGGMGARFGSKFYFGSSEKYRAGIQVTWVRFQIYSTSLPNTNYYSKQDGIFSPLGIAFANIIKFKDKQGLEFNLGVAPVVLQPPTPGDFGQWGGMYGLDVKYRIGRFAIGLDASRAHRGYNDILDMLSLSAGFKF